MNIFQKKLFCAIGNSNKDESDIQEPSSETKFSAKELSTILCEKPNSRIGVVKKSLFPKNQTLKKKFTMVRMKSFSNVQLATTDAL